MIIELTPDNFFEYVNREGPLNVIMHYGEACGPCRITMPHYETVVTHFQEHNVTNVKFYKFHQWDNNYKSFIEENALMKVNGVPTFKFFYMGEHLKDETRSFVDPNELKQYITEVMLAIQNTLGGFDLHES